MRRSSKLVGLVAAAAFLAALAWALTRQADLVQAEQKRPRPSPTSEGAPPEELPDTATGVQGSVDEGTRRALEQHLKAQAEARKRLDAPPPRGNRP